MRNGLRVSAQLAHVALRGFAFVDGAAGRCGKVTLSGKIGTLGTHVIGAGAFVLGASDKVTGGTSVEVTGEPAMTKDCPAPN